MSDITDEMIVNAIQSDIDSLRKSIDILDYKDNTTLEEGLSKMWEWARYQPFKKQRNMKYEIDENIYSYWSSDE